MPEVQILGRTEWQLFAYFSIPRILQNPKVYKIPQLYFNINLLILIGITVSCLHKTIFMLSCIKD